MPTAYVRRSRWLYLMGGGGGIQGEVWRARWSEDTSGGERELEKSIEGTLVGSMWTA